MRGIPSRRPGHDRPHQSLSDNAEEGPVLAAPGLWRHRLRRRRRPGARRGPRPVAVTVAAGSRPVTVTDDGTRDRDRLWAHAAWDELHAKWRAAHPELGDLWDRHMKHKVPADFAEQLVAAAGTKSDATRSLSGLVIQKATALAPWLAGVLGERVSVHMPYWVGAAAVLLGAGVLFATRGHLVGIDVEESELDEITEEATAITVGSDS